MANHWGRRSPGDRQTGAVASPRVDSGAGNGRFGSGWSLSLPSITRKTDKGLPQYQDDLESDVVILSGAEDLVPVLNSGGTRWTKTRIVDGITYHLHRYRPRIEGLFARIERWTNAADTRNVHWRSISKDNILALYGKDTNARIADPENPEWIFSWLICETRDDKGNAVPYEYKLGDRSGPSRTADCYLKYVGYGNRTSLLNDSGQQPPVLADGQIQNAGWMFEVVFDYAEHEVEAPRPDDSGKWDFRNGPFSTYRAGFEVRTIRLRQRVLKFHHMLDVAPEQKSYGGRVCSTDFTYSHGARQHRQPCLCLVSRDLAAC